MNILITGGTGFLGLALSKRLLAKGHHLTLLTRRPDYAKQVLSDAIETVTDIAMLNKHYAVVINLAGEPIVTQRWTEKRKALLRNSRIGLTEQLLAQLKRLPEKPELLISGSAIGYYGDQGDTVLTETAKPAQDFFRSIVLRLGECGVKCRTVGATSVYC
ncbi:NAD-dependent epimerase/dehydratase family protein [Methylocucumis oryzae]|uniref:NAD-dependent epimerase/dehydratase family protein n=1 Tax=Methylocucumis oryzae TaxID=1632867 RepID=UPI000AD57064